MASLDFLVVNSWSSPARNNPGARRIPFPPACSIQTEDHLYYRRLLQDRVRRAGTDRCAPSDRGCAGSTNIEVDHAVLRGAEVAHAGLVKSGRSSAYTVGQLQGTTCADHAHQAEIVAALAVPAVMAFDNTLSIRQALVEVGPPAGQVEPAAPGPS
jgi:hypothetical protein